MSENPYEAPQADNSELPERPSRVSIPGSLWLVTAIGIAAGLVLMSLFDGPLNVFVSIGGCMFAACGLCVVLMQGLRISLLRRLGLIVILTFASYILFVPMCTASGFVASMAGFSEQYGPNERGLAMAIVFSCVLVLNVVLAITLASLNRFRSKRR